MVNIGATATDNVGVTRVDLRVNGVTAASTNVAPYQFAWDSTTALNGPVAWTAVAFDAAGNSTTSPAIALSVSNAPANDTTPPSLDFIDPVDGAVVTRLTRIKTLATDNSGSTGITQMLYIDGALKITANSDSLEYRWSDRKVAPGVHTILVRATDARGNSTTKQVQVTRK